MKRMLIATIFILIVAITAYAITPINNKKEQQLTDDKARSVINPISYIIRIFKYQEEQKNDNELITIDKTLRDRWGCADSQCRVIKNPQMEIYCVDNKCNTKGIREVKGENDVQKINY